MNAERVFELALEAVNASIASVVLYLGFRILRSARLAMQRRSVNLLLAACVLFVLREILEVATTGFTGEIAEVIELFKELADTSFICCMAAAMFFVLRSEKYEMTALHNAAITDPLTGLYYVSFFRQQASQSITQANAHHAPLSLIMLDVDNFKAYNEHFGHEAGNLALKAVANVLRETARTNDLVARYGGEEFIALVPGTTDIALTVAERIRAAIETKCTPEQYPILSRNITISIGIATLTSTNKTLESLIEAADRQLYRAKYSGKNKVCADFA